MCRVVTSSPGTEACARASVLSGLSPSHREPVRPTVTLPSPSAPGVLNVSFSQSMSLLMGMFEATLRGHYPCEAVDLAMLLVLRPSEGLAALPAFLMFALWIFPAPWVWIFVSGKQCGSFFLKFSSNGITCAVYMMPKLPYNTIDCDICQLYFNKAGKTKQKNPVLEYLWSLLIYSCFYWSIWINEFVEHLQLYLLCLN